MAAIRDAEITVVGGGAIGCAVLHHLAEAGHRDLQLIEAGQLAGATSGQAAGLVGQVRTTLDRTKLAMASVALFSRLQDASPWPIDWRQTGSLAHRHDAGAAARVPPRWSRSPSRPAWRWSGSTTPRWPIGRPCSTCAA